MQAHNDTKLMRSIMRAAEVHEAQGSYAEADPLWAMLGVTRRLMAVVDDGQTTMDGTRGADAWPLWLPYELDGEPVVLQSIAIHGGGVMFLDQSGDLLDVEVKHCWANRVMAIKHLQHAGGFDDSTDTDHEFPSAMNNYTQDGFPVEDVPAVWYRETDVADALEFAPRRLPPAVKATTFEPDDQGVLCARVEVHRMGNGNTGLPPVVLLPVALGYADVRIVSAMQRIEQAERNRE